MAGLRLAHLGLGCSPVITLVHGMMVMLRQVLNEAIDRRRIENCHEHDGVIKKSLHAAG